MQSWSGRAGREHFNPQERATAEMPVNSVLFFLMATKAFSFISNGPRRNMGCPTFLQTCPPTNSEPLSFFRRSGAGTLRGDQGTPLPPSSGGGTRQNSPPQPRGD